MGLEMNEAFFQEPEHRPKPVIAEAGGIPLIDLSPLIPLPEILDQIHSACRDWGFFQLVNHGVPAELLEDLHDASREFFALPAEEKARVRRDAVNPWGYYEAEHTKNVRDWKEVLDFMVSAEATIPPSDGSSGTWGNQWPEFPPQLRYCS